MLITICGQSRLGLVKVKMSFKYSQLVRNWPLWLLLMLRVRCVYL
jgi:hypothetical protein